MTIEEVKAELKELKHLEKCVKVRETIRDLRVRRLGRLKSMEQTREVTEEIKEIKEIIKSLKINEYVKKVNKLENKYLGALSTLPPKEQILMLECFVNGERTYWQVGEQLGYSEDWVRAKVREITSYLADQITVAN